MMDFARAGKRSASTLHQIESMLLQLTSYVIPIILNNRFIRKGHIPWNIGRVVRLRKNNSPRHYADRGLNST